MKPKIMAFIGIILTGVSVFVPWKYWENMRDYIFDYPDAKILFPFVVGIGVILLLGGGLTSDEIPRKAAIGAIIFCIPAMILAGLSPLFMSSKSSLGPGYYLQVVALILYLAAAIRALRSSSTPLPELEE